MYLLAIRLAADRRQYNSLPNLPQQQPENGQFDLNVDVQHVVVFVPKLSNGSSLIAKGNCLQIGQFAGF